MASEQLLTGLLKDVSRSFYLTMRVLPMEVRPQISLAYLLARTSDTIADTGLIPADKRVAALGKFRARVLGRSNEALNFGEFAQNQSSPAEKVLLERAEDSISLLGKFAPDDQQRIREVLTTITSGQELDLLRFAHANEKRILALQSEAELDGYTYRVAGCVGEFWTKMCRAHLYSTLPWNDNFFTTSSVRFGKGLQMINILRDLPRDLRQGRCYIPNDQLRATNLKPEDLLDPANEKRFRHVYDHLLANAQNYLRTGWDYTTALPRSYPRVRLACAWPILIGAQTLNKLRNSNPLDPNQRIKVGRFQVWGIVIKSTLAHRSDDKFRALFR